MSTSTCAWANLWTKRENFYHFPPGEGLRAYRMQRRDPARPLAARRPRPVPCLLSPTTTLVVLSRLSWEPHHPESRALTYHLGKKGIFLT